LLADIDLSILGRAKEVFDAYEASIRLEYAWVSDPAFRAGRARVLGSFLARPRLFATPYFHERFETTARENLARSLAALASV
jgi:predicted metal-dependent HD superfamily phosphohydrolase